MGRTQDAARLGRALAAKGRTAEHRAAGRALVLLGSMDAGRLAETRRWAESVAVVAADQELLGAVELILELTEGIEPPLAPAPAPVRRARPSRPAGAPRPAGADSAAGPAERAGPPEPPEAPPGARRPRPSPGSRRLAVAAGAVALLAVAVGGVAGARSHFAPALTAAGPERDARIGPTALARLRFTVQAPAAELRRQRWSVDGRNVTRQVVAEGRLLVLRPRRLDEGRHRVEIRSRPGLLGGRRVRTFSFVVDTTPPALELPAEAATERSKPLTVSGGAGDAVRLTVAGRQVALDDGRFAVTLREPLPARVQVAAVDAAGNRVERMLRVTVVPRRPAVPIRAVHVTAYGWADRTLREGILRLIAEKRINAVELDLKDEAGLVGFPADVPQGRRMGAVQNVYDLGSAVALLHRKGVRVIGRLVCFRDPIHAGWAWKQGRRSEVVQTPSGGPYAGYGGFTNFADAAVRRYEIDVALAGARAGVDDILYDYVRRPDGPTSSMVFPGLRGTPEAAIANFLRESRVALAPYGTYLGASVFGVAATRPLEVAQDIPAIAREVDYVAPMVYPSHWGPGEYDVSNPNAQPFQIVLRSLRDFGRDTAGSGARVVPWLQDFSLGRTYGPAQVRAQIDAARRAGMNEFILWDPAVTYTADALTPDAPVSQQGLAKPKQAAPAASAAPAAAASRAAQPKRARAAARAPNELGVVPVLMHHEIRPDRVGPYDQTPHEFRAELEQLWREGYWPVRASDLVERRLDAVPAGKTPVVMTFDDATRYQLFRRNGKIVPDTAVGIMLDFARTHSGFRPAGTFYVLREPFGGTADGPKLLRWLVANGFELGNHTLDHKPLRTLVPAEVRRELALGQRVITDAVPGYRVRTLSLPLGSMPRPSSLARRGRAGSTSYRIDGVFLVGANPAPSPYSKDWDPGAIPRIRTSHLPYRGEADFTAAYWLRELARHPEQRYVSDGDPDRISVPAADEGRLASRFSARARR